MSYITQIAYADSGSVDAFQRLRVSSPETLFAVQSQYNTNPMQMESGATGTGVAPAHSSSTRMVAISATAGSGTSYMQSYQYFPYEPAMSQLIAITGVLGAATANAVKEFGYFDTANGIIYRQNGTSGLEIVRRSSTSGGVVEEVVSQASWNVDKLDGTGGSRITIDPTKSFILLIDLQFLGMGRVRVGFDIDGVLVIAHQFLNANSLTVPYMQAATLPVQALLTATSTATTATMYFKCAAVQSEGGFLESLGFSFSTPDASVTAANGTRTHLLSLRPKTTFNSIVNRELFIINGIDLLVTGNNPIYWELCTGVTLSSPATYANVNTASSAFEYGTGGTYSTVGGVVVASGYCNAAEAKPGLLVKALSLRYPVCLNRAGATFANGTLSLLVTGIGGTSATRAVLGFTEIR